MIEIRRAEPADGDALGEIHAAAWEAAYAPFFDPGFARAGVRDRRSRWHERIAGPDPDTVLLALADGHPLALSWSAPSRERPGSAELYSFYAHPDGWGTGIAAALMTGTLDHLRESGFEGVHLWTLRDTPRSRRFYAKSGFTASGLTRTHDFGDGHPLPQLEYQRPV
ncbi:GNAT family N-acetyltransferase [Streptomyces sp. NPDC101132]|uniref:GNAT family N-acetyltransferase n=1 Tax=Streptomyces sp. NPDC101132 TaxID=3366110 RepID=UPI0038145A37